MRSSSKRTTDSPLRLPTLADAARLGWRALRLRCPHCGDGAVLTRIGAVRARCSGCNFRFERSDESYFSGAMFFGLMMGEFLFGIVLLVTIVAMWPNVPWSIMTWAVPTGVLLVMIFIIPASRVVWLTVDVFVRPVQANELIG